MSTPHTLPAHALLTLPARRGDIVRVETGNIWFTVAGQDIVLQAGESFAIPDRQSLLIEAFSASWFQVETSAPICSGRYRGIGNVLGAWARISGLSGSTR